MFASGALDGVCVVTQDDASYHSEAVSDDASYHSEAVSVNATCRFKEYGAAGPALVLIHGWSGSSKYFQRNVDELAKSCRVVTLDLRFHGESDKPAWGFHVARLAADVHALIQGTWLVDARPALLGTSLGCAVIWSYVELFGEDRCSKFIFVDQAPSQWVFPDWKLGSKGIYDAASLENIQKAVQDIDSFADGNAACCLSKPPSGEVLKKRS